VSVGVSVIEVWVWSVSMGEVSVGVSVIEVWVWGVSMGEVGVSVSVSVSVSVEFGSGFGVCSYLQKISAERVTTGVQK